MQPHDPSILIVEDEKIAGRELAEMLKPKSRNVSLARSGKHAVTRVSQSKSDIDVILMDIKMPGELDGIDAAYQIQQDRRDIPIIFVTAYEENPIYHQRVAEAELNITGWVSKPIIGKNKDKLLDMIEIESKKSQIRAEIENMLREKASPANLQTLLEKLVSLHGVDLIAEVIRYIKWIHSLNGLNTDDLFPYLNFISYQNVNAELEKKYPDQFVAFMDGKLVGHNLSRDDLISSIYQKYERTDIFITKVSKGLTVLKLRRPRKVIR